MEKELQAKIIKWLKSKGCYVMKTQPGAGVPVGTSDIFFCKEGFYGWIEVKRSKTSKFQPLQREFIAKMDNWSWARVVYPENYDEVKTELSQML